MEHQLQLKIPCWVVAEAASDDLRQASQIVLTQAHGKSAVQVFLEKAEAERFMKEAGLSGKLALTIPSIQQLAKLTEHLQQQGVAEVHVFLEAKGEFKRAAVPMSDFNDGLRQHLAQP